MALNPFPVQSQLPVTKGMAMWTQPLANWFSRAWQILAAAEQASTTANRPTSNMWIGMPYFDTTLGIPIWWDGTNWIDAAGNTV